MAKATEDFPLDKISSVQWSSGMITGTIIVFASGNKAEITGVNKDDGKSITDLIRATLADQPSLERPSNSSPAASATSSEQDVFEQLRKLGELRDLGVITGDEFQEKKTQLLRGI